MAKRPTVTTVTSGYYGRTALNDNFTALRNGFDNTLSLDGSTPNAMGADLDMNSNDVTNVGSLTASVITLNGTVLSGSTALIAADATDVAITDAGGYFTGVTAELALQEVGADLALKATQAAVNLKADLASPVLTGTPTAPTAAAGTNTTQVATTAFVQTATSTASGMVFIESQDASASAALDFTGFDATKYDSYMFKIANLIPTSSGSLQAVTSTDGGSTWDETTGDYGYSGIRTENGATLVQYGNDANDAFFISDIAGFGSLSGISGTVEVFGPHTALRTAFTWQVQHRNNSTGVFQYSAGGGNVLLASDVNAVRFQLSNGTMSTGTISMYGMRNS